MPKYRSKLRDVVMFRYIGQPPVEWPEPFLSLWHSGAIRHHTANTFLLTTAGRGAAVLREGAWLALDTAGRPYSIADAVQHATYEPVPE